MATITRYVDVDAEVGGDGTTNALVGANCAYKSLSIWEAAQQQNLTDAGGDIAECICESSDAAHTADTTSCTIDGFTTAAASYIYVHSSAAARHAGVWSTSKYRLYVANAVALTIRDDHVRIDGIQIGKSSTNANNLHAVYVTAQAAGSATWLSNLILSHAGTYRQCGIYNADVDSTIYIWNVIDYGHPGVESLYDASVGIEGGTIYVYSSTLLGGRSGINRLGGTVTAKNCYASEIAGGTAYEGTITLTTCASSDASGSAGLQNIAVNTTNFTNVTAGTENFHLPAGSALINVGTDTSGDGTPLNFTTDIDGETRSGTWDVGADEYVAAAAGGKPWYYYAQQ